LELANAEETYTCLQKFNSSVQNRISTIKSAIEESKLKQLRIMDDADIQLVLKSEQVEYHMSDCLSHFNNATLVTYKHLTEINNRIIQEGKKNITAMRARMSLKKSILFKQWEYQCALTKAKHLRQNLMLLKNTKVRILLFFL
jgi:hypothetical protein